MLSEDGRVGRNALIDETLVADRVPGDWWRPESSVVRGNPVQHPASGVAPFWALMALMAVILLSPQTFFPFLAPFRIALLAAAVTLATYLFDRIRRQAPLVTLSPEVGLSLGLITWAFLMVPLSRWPGGSLGLLLDLFLKNLAVFWLLVSIVQSLTRLRQVLWGLSLITIPLAATALAHYSTETLTASVSTRIAGYDAALSGNPNDLALLLNLVVPLMVALIFVERKRSRQGLLLGMIALNVAAIIVTFSRAGFITLAVTAALYLWRAGREPQARWAWMVVVVVLMALPFLPDTYVARVGTILDKDSDPTGSAQERWRDLELGLSYVADHPLVGAGAGMNVLVLNDLRGETWREMHNVYLQYAMDLGLPGLLLFLFLCRACFRAVAEVRRIAAAPPGSRILFYIAQGIGISLAAFVVAAFFHPVAYHLFFYLVAGLAVAAKRVCEDEVVQLEIQN